MTVDVWSQRIFTYAERKPMGRQLKAVYSLMNNPRNPQWWTFADLRTAILAKDDIGISEAGVSARIRDLRKPAYGQHIIERRGTSNKGIYEYRMVA